MSRRALLALSAAALFAALPADARAQSSSGGMEYLPTPTTPAVAPAGATVGPDGSAVRAGGAPAPVVALIEAANRIARLPYRYGGGHRKLLDTAYDCSGSVSFALRGAGLLTGSLDSTGLARWGAAGRGTWISVYANRDHAFLVVAGLRFDTSGLRKAGTRWQPAPRATRGFRIRHPPGL